MDPHWHLESLLLRTHVAVLCYQLLTCSTQTKPSCDCHDPFRERSALSKHPLAGFATSPMFTVHIVFTGIPSHPVHGNGRARSRSYSPATHVLHCPHSFAVTAALSTIPAPCLLRTWREGTDSGWQPQPCWGRGAALSFPLLQLWIASPPEIQKTGLLWGFLGVVFSVSGLFGCWFFKQHKKQTPSQPNPSQSSSQQTEPTKRVPSAVPLVYMNPFWSNLYKDPNIPGPHTSSQRTMTSQHVRHEPIITFAWTVAPSATV